MTEPLTLSVEHGHLVETTTYDENLQPVAAWVEPQPGLQMNGHRADCRCRTCRPDVHVGGAS